jgi:hypothetical protein
LNVNPQQALTTIEQKMKTFEVFFLKSLAYTASQGSNEQNLEGLAPVFEGIQLQISWRIRI